MKYRAKFYTGLEVEKNSQRTLTFAWAAFIDGKFVRHGFSKSYKTALGSVRSFREKYRKAHENSDYVFSMEIVPAIIA